jgi:hypothetical protein
MAVLPRFSMRTFLVVLTIMVFVIAATAANHRLAGNAVYTLNWVLLGLSLAGAFLASGMQRRFWIGFAIFAWMHWNFGALPPQNPIVRGANSWNDPSLGMAGEWNRPLRLLTSDVVLFLEGFVGKKLSIGDEVQAQYNLGSYYPGVVDEIRDDEYLIRWTDGSSSPAQWTSLAQIQYATSSFRDAAFTALGSLWGLIGGMLAVAFFPLPAERAAPASRPETSTELSSPPQDESLPV